MIVIDILAAILFIDLADGFYLVYGHKSSLLFWKPIFWFWWKVFSSRLTGLMGKLLISLAIGYSWSKMFISSKWYVSEFFFFFFFLGKKPFEYWLRLNQTMSSIWFWNIGFKSWYGSFFILLYVIIFNRKKLKAMVLQRDFVLQYWFGYE